MTEKNKLRKIIFTILILLTILNLYLAISEAFGSTVCLANDPANCNTVQNSEYGKIFGIKLVWFGFAGSLVLLFLYYLIFSKNSYDKATHRIYIALISIGTILSIYFIYLQKFVLKTYCSSCLVVDISFILVYLLSVADYVKNSALKHRACLGS